jgi:hypothetical protein
MKFGFLVLVGHVLQYIQGAIHVNYQSPSIITIESCTNSFWLVFKKEKIYKTSGIIVDNAKMTYNLNCKKTYNLRCKKKFRGSNHKNNFRLFLTPKTNLPNHDDISKQPTMEKDGAKPNVMVAPPSNVHGLPDHPI